MEIKLWFTWAKYKAVVMLAFNSIKEMAKCKSGKVSKKTPSELKIFPRLLNLLNMELNPGKNLIINFYFLLLKKL